MHTNPVGSRSATIAARLLAVAATCAAFAAVLLPLATGGDWLIDLFRTPEPVLAPAFSASGALLVSDRRSTRLGWLLLAVGACAAAYVLATSVAWWAGPSACYGACQVRTWVWIPAFLLVTTVLPQVLPHGRPLAGWWRWPLRLAWFTTITATVVVAVLPFDGPFDIPAFPAVLAALVAVSLVSVVVRVRRADGLERRQLAWTAYGVVAATALTFLAPWWAVAAGVLLVPAGIAVAALRYRLYDIDLIVNRTLVAAALLGLAAVAYVALVAWTGALVGNRPTASFVSALALALAFHPVRTRVQRFVDRLLYGQRGDPVALLAALDDALADASSPRQAMREVARVVATGMKVTGVRVESRLRDDAVVREDWGRLAAGAVRLPLALHGETVGALTVSPRSASRTLDAQDLAVLDVLAGRAAALAYAVRLTGDVEQSREQLVSAREDERRRLRRDLHDGLGPQLSAVVMTLDTAASALRRGDCARAHALVGSARAEATDAVDDVRRLVHGLRPPALDDLGLLGALTAMGESLSGGDGPTIAVRCPGGLGALPAAVEVAALRIAQEAMLNAVKHASASVVDVHLVVAEDGGLRVTVTDDGTGTAPGRRSGVGMVSMSERAAELGGRLDVGPGPGGGTRLVAVLPFAGAAGTAAAS